MTTDELRRFHDDFQDDAIFARESLTVQNKLGQLEPMVLQPAQVKMAALRKKIIAAGKPVRIICLKARQVMISNYVAEVIYRDTVHNPGQNAMVIAHSDDSASKVFKYYQRFEEHYRPFRGIIAKPARSNDSMESLEYVNGSTIHFHTAKTVHLARGSQLRRLHFSEFAFYGDKARELMSACMAAMAKDPGTEVYIESTANGLGNEFHHLWQLALAGESDWVPFFFGWTEHPEYTLPLTERADVFQASLTDYERELRQHHNLTLEQLNWRRWTIRNDLAGDEALFKQEYPATPEEAFLNSGRPRFDLKAIERMPVVRDSLEGQLTVFDLGGEKRLRFEAATRGPLVIYRQPQPGRVYIVGADTAEGIDVSQGKGTPDPDYCAAQVHDWDTGEQVARLRARFTPAEFARQVWRLGVFYYWATIMPEINNHGFAFVQALVSEPLNYPPRLIYHRDVTPDQDPQVESDLIGWKTTPVTRPQLIDALHEAIRTQAIQIHDPITLSECRTFVIKPNGKAEAAFKCHDDTVIAEALVVMGIQRMRRPQPVSGKHNAVNPGNKYKTHRDSRGGDAELKALQELRKRL